MFNISTYITNENKNRQGSQVHVHEYVIKILKQKIGNPKVQVAVLKQLKYDSMTIEIYSFQC